MYLKPETPYDPAKLTDNSNTGGKRVLEKIDVNSDDVVHAIQKYSIIFCSSKDKELWKTHILSNSRIILEF